MIYSYSGRLVTTNVFTVDDADYLNADIYAYIVKHVFLDKPNDALTTKDVIKFFSDYKAVAAAKKHLVLNDQELIYFIMRYFNENTTIRYHPVALARHIKKHLAGKAEAKKQKP